MVVPGHAKEPSRSKFSNQMRLHVSPFGTLMAALEFDFRQGSVTTVIKDDESVPLFDFSNVFLLVLPQKVVAPQQTSDWRMDVIPQTKQSSLVVTIFFNVFMRSHHHFRRTPPGVRRNGEFFLAT